MNTMPAIDAFKLMNATAPLGPELAMSRVEANARIRFTVAQALSQGRLFFHFQPVVRADNPKFPAFFEMLARLRLPSGQVLPAGAFLPSVEAGVLGRAIDRLALSQALRCLAENPSLRLSVNISPLSMGDEEWLETLAAAHRGGSGVCGRLILEITEEAALAEAAQTIEFMDYVRPMGPAFALDDFGAGATGFRHFSKFRFDMAKIDGSFVNDAHKSPDNQVFIECLMRLARHFELLTVAERVETAEEANWLRGAGVDCLQGYLYGRPSSVPELNSGDGPGLKAAG